jgi:hypothetical protein
MSYTDNNQPPDYNCQICNFPLLIEDIFDIHIEGNNHPIYFCSVGCYHIWDDDDIDLYDGPHEEDI